MSTAGVNAVITAPGQKHGGLRNALIDGRTGLIIILVCAALLVITGSALHRTSATTETYFGTIQALVEHNSLALDQTSYISTIDKVFTHGHFYTHKPLLLPVIGAAVYWPLSKAGLRLTGRTQSTTEIVISVILCGGSFLLAIIAFYWALGDVISNSSSRLLLTATLAFCTSLLTFATVLNGQVFAACWITVGFACLVRSRREASAAGLTGAAGLAFGIATGVDHASAALTGMLALCVLYRRRTVRDITLFVLPSVLVFGASLYVNHQISGSIKPLSSQIELFSYPGSYWTSGAEALSGKRNSLDFAVRYCGLCLFGLRGFLWYNPVLLIAFACLFAEIASRGTWSVEAAAVLIASVSIVIFYSFTSSNFSGASYTIRWFLLFVPPSLFFAFRCFNEHSRRWKQAFLGLAACGLVLALGGWVDPWTPPSRYPAFLKNVGPRVVRLVGRLTGSAELSH